MENHVHLVSIANALVAWTVVYLLLRPALERAGERGHLLALTAPHLFRYVGLIALVPSLFDMRALGFSDSFHAVIGYGDWISGLLALVAILLLMANSRFAIPALWVFNIVGLLDFANAGLRIAPAIQDPAIIGDLGWVVFTVFLPMLIVSHAAGLVVLARRALAGRSGR
jgi:hypothetical protein